MRGKIGKTQNYWRQKSEMKFLSYRRNVLILCNQAQYNFINCFRLRFVLKEINWMEICNKLLFLGPTTKCNWGKYAGPCDDSRDVVCSRTKGGLQISSILNPRSKIPGFHFKDCCENFKFSKPAAIVWFHAKRTLLKLLIEKAFFDHLKFLIGLWKIFLQYKISIVFPDKKF